MKQLDWLEKGLAAKLALYTREIGIAGCLILLVLGVYFPVRNCDFVNIDDQYYVPRNDHVMAGLTAESLRWAFTSTEDGNWFPLTRISYMIDRDLFGPRERQVMSLVDAEPYHWTNVILHAASSVLLFALLRWLTGAIWPSAFVAALFGIHPQHVESVAWVAERKDVLSALFWMLALWSYAAYGKRPRATPYLLTLLFYCCGFMSKPMVVTLPAVLLLMDIWPLQRFPGQKMARLIREKAPFFALAVAMAAVTFVVQRAGGSVRTLQQFPLGFRLENALVSAVVYVGAMFWPARLAVFYPMPDSEPAWQVIGAGLALAGITMLAVLAVRTRPYLTVGWFWFAIAILPVIGIVQVGFQMRADRYIYLPSIGLSIMLAWGGADLCRRWPAVRPVLAGLGAAACLACCVLTSQQISYWQTSRALWEHNLAVTDRNYFAHYLLGIMWQERGFYDDAIAEYQTSLAIFPKDPGVEDRLGDLLNRKGRTAEALAVMTKAVEHTPTDAILRHHFGIALDQVGRRDEAVRQLEEAVRLKPGYWEAQIRLGNVLTSLGRTAEANEHYAKAFLIHDKASAGKPQESQFADPDPRIR
jgi:predicted negative regulator of RcsB-dependent stress response